MNKRHLHIDCSTGISGDMFLAALASAGLDIARLEAVFQKAGIDLRIICTPLSRSAGPGMHVDVEWKDNQPLRHLSDLTEIISRLDAPQRAKDRACNILTRLAEAEAHVHQEALDHVHFHEVGAIDTLVDVFGAVWGLEELGISSVSSTPVPWFSGFVTCSHGTIPLPAPATARLLEGKPIFSTDAREELITPTGAAILDGLVDSFEDSKKAGSLFKGMTFVRKGLGYGSREPSEASDWPARGFSLILLEQTQAEDDSAYTDEEIMQLSCHIDHLSGEEIGRAIDVLMAEGALDVLWLQGTGKKSRPAGELHVLCHLEDFKKMRELIFKHTHTLGLRYSLEHRNVVPREATSLSAKASPQGGDALGNNITGKAYLVGGVRWVKPEHDALVQEVERLGLGLPAMRVHRLD